MIKFIKHNVWFHLILIFVGVLILFYWAFIDGVLLNTVLDKKEINYTTTKTEYFVGEDVLVNGDGICKNRNVSAKVYMFLTDTIQIPYAVREQSLPVGCYNHTLFLVNIPNIAPPGKYYIQGYYSYEINPIRTGELSIKIPFQTNEFEIIK